MQFFTKGRQLQWTDCIFIYLVTGLSTYLFDHLLIGPLFKESNLITMSLLFLLHVSVMGGGSLFFVLKVRRQNLADALLLKPISPVVATRSALYGVGLFLGMLMLAGLLDHLLPGGLPKQDVASFFNQEPRGLAFALSILIMAVLAPIAEELLFRGYLFNALRSEFSLQTNMVFTALVFGLVHGDPYRLLPLALGGYLLNRIAWREKSLYASIIAHGVWNFCMILATFLVVSVKG